MRSPSSSLLSVLLLLVLLPSALAIFKDDAYSTDWHIALIGPSLPDSTFFHRPQSSSKANLVYSLTSRSILAAINPKDGQIVWRQSLGEHSTDGVVRGGDGVLVAAVAGTVSAFDAGSGRLVWENAFADAGKVLDVRVGAANDAVVLFEDGKVRLLDGATGDVKWEQQPLKGKDVPVSLILTDETAVLVSITPSKKVNFNRLVLTNGLPDSSITAVLAPIDSPSDLYSLGSDTLLVWTEGSGKSLKLYPFGDRTSPLSVPVSSDAIDIKVHIHNNVALVHYIAKNRSWAEVYKVKQSDKGPSIVKVYEIDPRRDPSSSFSASPGSTDDEAFFLWTLSTGEAILYSSMYSGPLASYPLKTPLDVGKILHTVSEVVPRADGTTYAVRTFLSTSKPGFTGDSHLIRNGERVWTRKESLASITHSTWLELLDPATEKLVDELAAETHKNIVAAYIHRVTRHINELITYGPAWLAGIPGRVARAFVATDSTDEETTGKWRDFFGFRKYVVVATEEGGLAAIDVGHKGQVVWQDTLRGLPAAGEWKGVVGLYEVGKGVVGVVVGSGEYIEFDVFESKVLQREKLPLKPRSTSLTTSPSSGEPLILVFGTDGRVVPASTKFTLGDNARLHLAVREHDSIQGLRIDASFHAEKTWTFRPPKDEELTSVVPRPAHDPVASIGRVLGDRSVMYKYLNPHVVVATSVSHVRSTASIHLLDAVSGALLHTTSHAGVDTSQPPVAALSENWLVYSYFGDSDVTATSVAKGPYLVVSELYESAHTNDRGALGDQPAFSSVVDNTAPHVLSHAFLLPAPVSAFAVTATKQGITAREILALTPAGIVAIPKRVLDPRRPVGRDPNADEREEGLLPYQPVVELDPRAVITHERAVVGLRNIVTSPAALESTSLVFAYGGDLFGTRVAPSLLFDMLGKGFSRVQLLVTVVALLAGVGFVAPMVRRKQINARWKAV